jgi:hypothetical protein
MDFGNRLAGIAEPSGEPERRIGRIVESTWYGRRRVTFDVELNRFVESAI